MTKTVRTHDGLALDVFATELRHETTVVFANALGIASSVTEGLAAALFAGGVNFVTWDGRGFPGPYDESFRRYDSSDQAKDLAAVVASLNLRSFVLSAWCTGIHTALAYAAASPDRVRSLVLFNSPNYFESKLSDVVGDAIGKVSKIIVADEKKLDFFYANIVATNTDAAQARMTGLASGSPLQRLVQAPFSSGKEALLRYAHLINNSSKFVCDAQTCRGITRPALVVGGRADTMVSYRDSISLAQTLPDGVVKIFDDWNHYTVFSEPASVVNDVFAGWLGHTEGRGPSPGASPPAPSPGRAPQPSAL